MHIVKESNNMNSIKRPEENYKFVFKRCLKYMKETLKKKSDYSKLNKKEFEKSFTTYYFQEIADSNNLSIENYYHPKNSNQQSKSVVKTINSQYIGNIVQSKLFVTDFMSYLNDDLDREYKLVIKQKMKSLFERWEKEYQLSVDKEKAIENICQNIEKNIKCKLPWTITEVYSAIESVKQLFKENMDVC